MSPEVSTTEASVTHDSKGIVTVRGLDQLGEGFASEISLGPINVHITRVIIGQTKVVYRVRTRGLTIKEFVEIVELYLQERFDEARVKIDVIRSRRRANHK